MSIVDRRSNPGSKSLPNRNRFIKRAEAQVRQAVSDSIARRKVADVGSGTDKVRVSGSGTSEPFLHHGRGGDVDHVLPGNVEHLRGDKIARPQSGGGRGGGAGDSGDGEDGFEFTLTRDEFLDIYFQDLELPDMIKATLLDDAVTRRQRAGFSTTGSASSLNLGRTMHQSVGRRVGMGRKAGGGSIAELLKAVDLAVEDGDAEVIALAREALKAGIRTASRVPWIDPHDLRYNRYEPRPNPVTGAVMFCLMDVSASMTDHMKDLAKRFFMLLHLFLERRYERVSLVFIRHTHQAHEVDEDTFFYSKETGGTMVSTALEVLLRVQRERFPLAEWNIYVAQASDGDNSPHDDPRTLALMSGEILPIVQYFAYIEVQQTPSENVSDLWKAYGTLGSTGVASRLAMRRVASHKDIWGVFADLFARDRKLAA